MWFAAPMEKKKRNSNHIIVCLNTNTDGHPECLYYNADKLKTPEIKRTL